MVPPHGRTAEGGPLLNFCGPRSFPCFLSTRDSVPHMQGHITKYCEGTVTHPNKPTQPSWGTELNHRTRGGRCRVQTSNCCGLWVLVTLQGLRGLKCSEKRQRRWLETDRRQGEGVAGWHSAGDTHKAQVPGGGMSRRYLPRVPRMAASQTQEPAVGQWLIRRLECGGRGPGEWEAEFALDSVGRREPRGVPEPARWRADWPRWGKLVSGARL